MASNAPVGSYSKLTGDPAHGAVPPGEYNVLETLMGAWEALVGYSVEPTNAQLLAMANSGVMTLADFGKFMSGQANAKTVSETMPWATYGLSKDEYATASETFGTTYKSLTGQDISPDALQAAFAAQASVVGNISGALLTGSEYRQQLMNDSAIQKQFGWVKYGLDFAAWTQQKLTMGVSFGRTINDSEAATLLQYTKAAAGSNMAAVGRASGQQSQTPAAPGLTGSVAR